MIHITECLIGLSTIAWHFAVCCKQFGMTAVCLVLGIQVPIALWMAYKQIRAPTMEQYSFKVDSI